MELFINLIKVLVAFAGVLWLFAGGYLFYLSRKAKK